MLLTKHFTEKGLARSFRDGADEAHRNGADKALNRDNTLEKILTKLFREMKLTQCLFVCFVALGPKSNSYGHGGPVSSPNHIFPGQA